MQYIMAGRVGDGAELRADERNGGMYEGPFTVPFTVCRWLCPDAPAARLSARDKRRAFCMARLMLIASKLRWKEGV
jgi:hypothetical protein